MMGAHENQLRKIECDLKESRRPVDGEFPNNFSEFK